MPETKETPPVSVVTTPLETGPLPITEATTVTPMKEGKAVVGVVPTWLTPYANRYDAVRKSLTAPEVPLFDSLWGRACGEGPVLSGRERERLLTFLKPMGVTQ